MALARYESVAVNLAGDVIPNATVEVRRDQPGRPVVPLWADREGTVALGNPITTDSEGKFGFHVTGGSYYIRVFTGPAQQPLQQYVRRYQAIGTAAERDVEQLATALETGTATFPTLPDLQAFTPAEDEGIGGKVTTGEDAGFYHYDPSEDPGERWIFDRPLYDSLARMNVTGGDENDIEAEIASGVSDASVVMLWIEAPETNTGPVTINAKPVLNSNEEDLSAGQWVEGRTYWFSDEGAFYKLRTDSDVSDLVAQVEALADQVADDKAAAEAASAAAIAAAAGVNLPPIAPGDVGKQLFVNADEDGYELLDPPEPVTDGDKGAIVVSGNGSIWTDAKSILAYIPVSLHAAIADRSIVADLSSYIQEALNNETYLVFPPGRYPITSINIVNPGTSLSGSGYGPNGSEFYCLGASGDRINSYAIEGTRITDFRWVAAVPQTGGTYVVTGPFFHIDNFYMEGAYRGLVISQGLCTVADGYVWDTVPSVGVGIHVAFGDGLLVRHTFMTNNLVGQARAAILVTSCFDLHIDNCGFYGMGYDLEAAPTGGSSIGSIICVNTFFDTAARGVYFHPSAGSFITRSSFTGCWFGSHAEQGVLLDGAAGQIDDTVFSGCRFADNDVDGLLIESDVFDTVVAGNTFAGNIGAAISLSSESRRTVITGNRIGQTQQLPANGYGIFINSGADNYLVEGNLFGVNGSGSIAGHIAGASRVVRDNLGFRTENKGLATVAGGANSVSVAHGLASTPAKEDVTIAALSLSAVDAGAYVAGTSATNIVIQTKNNASGEAFFSWSARL